MNLSAAAEDKEDPVDDERQTSVAVARSSKRNIRRNEIEALRKPPRTPKASRVRAKTVALAFLTTALCNSAVALPGPSLAGSSAERKFVANPTPDHWRRLLGDYASYYADPSRSKFERDAALHRAMDILALDASATGRDVGQISSIGGRSLSRPYYVVSYRNFFQNNFSRYRFASESRRTWTGKTVVVAVSKETCDLKMFRFSRRGQIAGRLADYFGGFYDPFKPNAFFKVALGDSEALRGADVDYAIASCEKDDRMASAFPRFVVYGQVICDDADCRVNPQFLISRIDYSWSAGNVIGFLSNSISTAGEIRDVLKPLGIH